MDEQREWIKLRRKKRLRLLAVAMCVSLLITSYPNILETWSVSAAAEKQGIRENLYIYGFEELSEEIKEQYVPVGTELEELTLPAVLEVSVGEIGSNTPENTDNGADDEKTENDGMESEETSGGEDPSEDGDGNEEDSEGQSDTETDSGEENTDIENGEGQDGQSGESVEEETDTAEMDTEEDADNDTYLGEESMDSDEPEGVAVAQETYTVTLPEYQAENVISVETLENTQDTEPENVAETTVTISGITWQSDLEYDGNTEGTYIFTAVLPDGYTLAEGVSLPKITVIVRESDIDIVVQTLLERIAALPEVEEYLSEEPEVGDEEAYVEWEEKLYEYAEEALAIWEEYEALTEEQQAQMPEEELVKLTAWVELAEQLSESNMVMLADDSEHHAGWKALSENNTTLENENYYLADDVTMDTITIEGTVTLCLNGHTLTHSDTAGSVIFVAENATFTLCDCQDRWGHTSSFDEGAKTYTCEVTGNGGCITGGNGNNSLGGGVYVSSGATFNMTSGRITRCDVGTGSNHYGGGVYVTGGEFNMSGGVIDTNNAMGGGGICIEGNGTFEMSSDRAVIMLNTATQSGAGVTCNVGKFDMKDGKIIGNSANMTAGGVNVGTSASLSMTGGLIEGNTIINNSTFPAGMFIYGNAEISGGVIRYNVSNSTNALSCGGVKLFSTTLTSGSLKLSGEIQIFDNYCNNNQSNLFITTGKPITIAGALSNPIGITSQTKPTSNGSVEVANNGGGSYTITNDDWKCFTSDSDSYEILKKETDTGNELWLVEKGSCDLGDLDLSAEGATLSPAFAANITEYTSTVANSVEKVGITATLADSASDASITMKINGGTETSMTSGVKQEAALAEGKNIIEITVTSGEMSKTYTLVITREEAKRNRVTITAYKDDNVWSDNLPQNFKFKLTSDDGANFIENLTAVPDGEYKIYVGDTDTNVTVTVNGAEATARVDYYTVTFYDGDTVLTAPAQKTVLKSSTASAPTGNFTKTGYSFNGWVTADGGSTKYDFTAAVTGKTSVYASWTPDTYTINYELNGGTATGNPAGYTIESSDISLKEPTKAGYTFTGWSGTDLTGSTNMTVTIPAGSTGNRTYEAHWNANQYAVTLNGNGGSGTDLDSYTVGTGATLPNWTRTGYAFDGWYDNAQCTGTAVTEISATDIGDKEYWAKWTANTYEVSFAYHGADSGNTTDKVTVTYDSTYGTLPAPARTGYSFQGWYTAENGQGSKVEAATVVNAASAHTLHAHWLDDIKPDKPVLQTGVTLPADWTGTQKVIPLKLYDGVGVTELWVSIDGKDYVKAGGFTGGTGNINYDHTLTEGEHTYQFKAKDAAGNTSEESDLFTVRLDTAKPEIGAITYENKVTSLWNWIIGKKSLIIHVRVTDEGSGVTQITYTMTPRDSVGNPDTGSAVTDTADVKNGEAQIKFNADFKGTITISCTDAAGNTADSVTIGASGGVIVEDNAPVITADGKKDYYDTAEDIHVTVKDDTGSVISAGIDTVTYQVGEDGTEKTVTIDKSTLQAAEEVAFTIPASEIPTGITEIKITATDNAGNTRTEKITVKVKGPEKQPAAKIDYREEELTGLVPGGQYKIDGTEITADAEGHIEIKEEWLGTTLSIVKKGNGSETSDSTAQSLPIPARPAAPNAPELNSRTEQEIVLKTISGAQFRIENGGWQDSTNFAGLTEKTEYSFKAYYPATDTSFASPESSEAQIATMPYPPAKEKLVIDYTGETMTLTDGIEAFTDANCTTPVTAGSAEDYMGTTVYIRYPAEGIIPASKTTAVQIPARPGTPTPAGKDASYPGAADGAITGLTAGVTYMVSSDGGRTWETKTADTSGGITGLKAGTYEVYVAAGSANFRSETADVTIGEKPATKQATPNIQIDYENRTLTGFLPDGEYTINGEKVTVKPDGTMEIKAGWFDSILSIIRKGNGKDKLDSDPQSLSIPEIPAKPTPTGVDVETAGGTGKLTGLTAGTTYEVSTDGGRTWETKTADGNGEITGLAPGSYTVRVKAGTSNFASEPSDPAKIGAYQIKVTFMVDGEVYDTISVDYGGTLTNIPAVPSKDGMAGEWCVDEQGSSSAAFTNITADMTVYAVYTTAYTVTLQPGTGYTLTAAGGSTSPVKEGTNFSFRLALSSGYITTSDFAVKVNGTKVDAVSEGNGVYTYTITDIRENKTVTVEGIKKDESKPNPPSGGGNDGDGGNDPDPEPVTPPTETPTETETETPEPPSPLTPQPAETPDDKPGTTEGTPENVQPEDDSEPESTETPEPTGTEKEPETVPASTDNDRIVISGEPIRTGNVNDMTDTSTTLSLGDGAIIVTVVCKDQTYTAGVADTVAVANAVLTQEQLELINSGETIEIRIEVTDISDSVPQQDKEVIESGIEEYSREVPGLTLGMYVDLSMFIRIGAGDWNAITATKEPIEVIIGVPDSLQEKSRTYYIIRAHEGEYTFMSDMDNEPDTITISTDMFSSYAIAYVETESAGADGGSKCGLCHICPTFLGICYFIWLAVIVAVILVILMIVWRRKREEKESEEAHGA